MISVTWCLCQQHIQAPNGCDSFNPCFSTQLNGLYLSDINQFEFWKRPLKAASQVFYCRELGYFRPWSSYHHWNIKQTLTYYPADDYFSVRYTALYHCIFCHRIQLQNIIIILLLILSYEQLKHYEHVGLKHYEWKSLFSFATQHAACSRYLKEAYPSCGLT